ncbi:MAG TPA: PQQ-binding-like beta-propeller repeat protein [Planctomycetes bacterium]|nr:PQQ-binding-like beta-propeller repeat protein [Planctomycetota bacterium]
MSKIREESFVDSASAGAAYQAALWSAVVSGVFSAIVLVLLVVNYLQIKVLDPLRAERLEMMKVKFIGEPLSEDMLFDIRRLDLEIRRDKIRRQFFSRRGGYLLLGGLVVCVAGLKLASVLGRRPPQPAAPDDKQARQMREAAMARWAVTAGLGLLSVAALIVAFNPQINITEITAPAYPSEEQINNNWAGFRGPAGAGISAYENIPTKWDGKTGDGILWKSKVPLRGHNSPVVWAGRVFLSGATSKKRQVFCFDALSGELLWTADVAGTAAGGTKAVDIMDDTGYAAPTVATDGRRVYAIFANGDLGCFDFDGKSIWTKSLGVPDSTYGYASSLAMYRNLLLIQYDQGMAEEVKSRMIAIDGYSGRIVWEVRRPVAGSWASPIVAKVGEKHQLITCSDPWITGYNPATGEELWKALCGGADMAPSPVYAGGFVFAVSPYDHIVAIRPDGRGDVTDTHISWSAEDSIPDICSPVSNGKVIFLLHTAGTLTCYQCADGKILWEKELDTSFNASPSLVGDKIYLLSTKGVMFIARIGAEYEEIARCELGEKVHASAAFANGRIYIRGTKNLYCIGTANE